MFSFDILIVGAGPAGCAAAYDLAEAGRRVLLLDRRTFPRHKACACGLTRKTLAALRYSVDPVVERVCKEIVLQPVVDGKRDEVRVKTRTPICAMAVREKFDAFCLAQTLKAGRNGGSVTFRKVEGVAALREFADRVEVELIGGEIVAAPVVIGADGSNGIVRRLASSGTEPAWYSRGFALEATVPFAELPSALPGGDAAEDLVFDFAPLPGGYGWLFPKGDHINIGVGAFAPPPAHDDGTVMNGAPDSSKAVTKALLAEYSAAKLGVRELRDVTGQHLGMGGHAYVPQGRVLLVGDAAGLVDPLTGEGIHSALVSGQAAAAAVVRGGDVAAAYARELAPLQQTLAFSHRAARAFYREPERGFKVMRMPLVRGLVLKTYADGLPVAKLLTTLSKVV